MTKQTSLLLFIFLLLLGCSSAPDNLGVNNGQLKDCPTTPNCVTSQTTDEGHFVAPIKFSGTTQEAQKRLLQVLESFERTKIVAQQDNYIRAEFTSKIFRFVDDVEFYFPVSENSEIIIHLRSASRIGYSDMGANKNRIEQIRDKF